MATTTIKFTPAMVNIVGYAGDTLTVRCTVGDPSLLAGATWAAQVREARDDEDFFAEFTVLPEANGALLVLDAEVTAELAGIKGFWDVQISDGANVRTLAQGSFAIDQDVTRP